jgi:hypothetical protein
MGQAWVAPLVGAGLEGDAGGGEGVPDGRGVTGQLGGYVRPGGAVGQVPPAQERRPRCYLGHADDTDLFINIASESLANPESPRDAGSEVRWYVVQGQSKPWSSRSFVCADVAPVPLRAWDEALVRHRAWALLGGVDGWTTDEQRVRWSPTAVRGERAE